MNTQAPFPASDFDSWAKNYDKTVQEDTTFPFDGYNLVLQEILDQAQTSPGQSVLDLGAGTGNLALLFTEQGCRLTCADFSQKMLALARAKLPQADFFLHDLRFPLPLGKHRFDAIVSAYVFHHFPLTQKIEICQCLIKETLAENGSLLIGDISFSSFAAQEEFKQTIPDWEDEYYWFADETLNALHQTGLSASYIQVSPCAGVYKIHRGIDRKFRA